MTGPGPAFDDLTDTLDAPEKLSDTAAVLGSRTRVAILRVLIASPTPLNINEVARRVGIDASPARSHLEALARGGLAQEDDTHLGRERRFSTRLTGVRIVLEGINRDAPPSQLKGPPREVLRLEKKLAALADDQATLDRKAAALRAEMRQAWAKAVAEYSAAKK